MMAERYDSRWNPIVFHMLSEQEETLRQVYRILKQCGIQEHEIPTTLAALHELHNKFTRKQRLLGLDEIEKKRRDTWLRYLPSYGSLSQRLPTLFHLYRERIQSFFASPEYTVGKTEQSVVYVLNSGVLRWEELLSTVAKSLQEHLVVVDKRSPGKEIVIVVDDEFYNCVAKRIPHEREQAPAPPDDIYVLCGVHGGSVTHELRLEEMMSFFKGHQYFGLSLHEALSMIVTHPVFLSPGKGEPGAIVMLGETYPDLMMFKERKFAVLYYDGENELRLFLVPSDEVSRFPDIDVSDRARRDPKGNNKPYAKHLIADSRMD